MMTSSTSPAQSPKGAYKISLHAPMEAAYGANPKVAIKGGFQAPGASQAAAGQVFVLSNRPIAGQNSLVVSSGYADLMDALRAAGGASVTVS